MKDLIKKVKEWTKSKKISIEKECKNIKLNQNIDLKEDLTQKM